MTRTNLCQCHREWPWASWPRPCPVMQSMLLALRLLDDHTHATQAQLSTSQAISRSKLGTTTAPFLFSTSQLSPGRQSAPQPARDTGDLASALPSALSGLWFSAVTTHPHDILPQAPCSFLSPLPLHYQLAPPLPRQQVSPFPPTLPHFFSRCFPTPRLSLLLKTLQFPLTTLSRKVCLFGHNKHHI